MTAPNERLGQAPVGQLFTQMALPIIFALLVNGLYNIVDTLFISRGVGALAIGGVSIVFPVQMAIFAVAAMVGSGASSLVSRHLGSKNFIVARAVAGNALKLALLFGCAFLLLVQCYLEPLLKLLGVTDALRPYALSYLLPILYGTPVVMLLCVLNDLIRAEGKAHFLMLSITMAAVINGILDAIAVYVFHWGVTGVAFATVSAQFITLLFVIWLYVSGRIQLKIYWTDLIQQKNLSDTWLLVRQIIALGLPIFLSHIGISLVITLVNSSLSGSGLAESDYLISAYGILGRVFTFVFFPMLGMSIAYQTLCSYNFGAGKYSRVRSLTLLVTKRVSCYCLLVTIIMVTIPEKVFSLFSNDAKLLQYTAYIAHFAFVGFFMTGASNVFATYFQAIGKAKQAVFLSTFRVYLLQIPLLLIVPRIFNVNAIWYIYPFADIATFIMTSVFIFIGLRELKEYVSEKSGILDGITNSVTD